MVFYQCDSCRETYQYESEEDVLTRSSRLEDCVGADERVLCCPQCGEEIYKVETCCLCGEKPAADNEACVCSGCEARVKADFRDLMIHKYNKQYLKSDCEMETILLNILC